MWFYYTRLGNLLIACTFCLHASMLEVITDMVSVYASVLGVITDVVCAHFVIYTHHGRCKSDASNRRL